MDKIDSKTIDLLRFPLAVFVVLIHTNPTLELKALNEATFPLLSGTGIYNLIEISLKSVITVIAVPVFFIISGYLFFQKLNIWNWDTYKIKIRTRMRTLFIPYICWIALSFMCTALIPTIKDLVNGNSISDFFSLINEHRISFIGSFWDGIIEHGKFPNWIGMAGESSYPLIVPCGLFVT